ncbi:MAG TPA: tetratricopeptide repeat protein, partial [Gemmatimonadales bacterium]|nr:tetratricopeptide repeat protein [Gemmatimonadales bacterium]
MNPSCRWSLGLAGGLSVAATGVLGAQTSRPTAVDSVRGEAMVFAGQWAAAVGLYQRLSQRDAKNRQYWLRFGQALDAVGRLDEAERALKQALELGAPAPLVHYRLARIFARRGDGMKALQSLNQAAETGFAQYPVVASDAAFNILRGDSSFARVLTRLEANRFPCRASPASRQFDFWLGDWSVRASGTEVGTSRIHLIGDRCALLENYDAPNLTVRSLNFFDPRLAKWRQVVVLDNGVF